MLLISAKDGRLHLFISMHIPNGPDVQKSRTENFRTFGNYISVNYYVAMYLKLIKHVIQIIFKLAANRSNIIEVNTALYF